jgi:hypothetical protein
MIVRSKETLVLEAWRDPNNEARIAVEGWYAQEPFKNSSLSLPLKLSL